MTKSPWLQPITIVILAAALAGMTTFALGLRATLADDTRACRVNVERLQRDVAEARAVQALVLHELDRVRTRLERLEAK